MYDVPTENDEYIRLRGRVYNLFHNDKRLGRQVRRLLKDLQGCSPDAQKLALRDAVRLHLHRELPRRACIRGFENNRDFNSTMENLKALFGEHFDFVVPYS